MNRRKYFCVVSIFLFILLIRIEKAQAFLYLDMDKTMTVAGKIQTRATFRTQDSKGFTFPQIEAGDLVQHRNLGYLEFLHDLKKATGLNLKYRLVGRFLYEGLYDYGPHEFKDVRAANKDEIDEFKMDGDLWEGYVELLQGPLFFRLGRQNLAWGETDIFRLLDNINPLDNTFGFVFEDLDDRRIPLWMARASYNFGRVLGISSLALEGFWNPGFAGQKVSPLTPFGTPYAAPVPPAAIPTVVVEPDDTMQSSRYGLRVQGLIAENFNFSLAHYRTIWDSPGGRIAIYPGPQPVQELIYKKGDITGGSLSFFEPHTSAIIRSEVAWFWNEPVFIPEKNLPLLFGRFVSGSIPKKDVLRFVVGFDRAFWIRPLNKLTTFFFSFQYFGEWFPDWDKDMRIPAPRYPDGRFLRTKRYGQQLTLICSTSYLHGTLNPSLAAAYDVNGAWLFSPTLEYIFEPFRIKLQYANITGKYTGFGLFRDRDQVSLNLSYLF